MTADNYDAVVSLVIACESLGVVDRAADALRVVERIKNRYGIPGSGIESTALYAVHAAILGEPEPIGWFGIKLAPQPEPLNMAGRASFRVDQLLTQTEGWT